MAGGICVVGIGNVLMGDDALGPHAVRLLEAKWDFGDGVSAIDAGTPGIELASFANGMDALIIVDAVKAQGRPGEVRLYRKAELLDRSPVLATSPHDPGVREALLTLEFAGGAPDEVLLVGVIPQQVDGALGLSAPVRAALPEVEAAVLRELERLGKPARPREAVLEPDLWWEPSRP